MRMKCNVKVYNSFYSRIRLYFSKPFQGIRPLVVTDTPSLTIVLFPKTERMLETLGMNLRLAHLRRNIPMRLQAKRMGVSVATLVRVHIYEHS